jgi:hypothetical protein
MRAFLARIADVRIHYLNGTLAATNDIGVNEC